MKLINTGTLKLETFPDERNLRYAILSHRWEEEEVLFEHMWPRYDLVTVRRMKGFGKIEKCCKQARQDGIPYAWVDTCCIDKSSSAELQEAINSMFRWYSSAIVCYVFLSDVTLPDSDNNNQFRTSQWFKRGWTLQELVAPNHLQFFDRLWSPMGDRIKFAWIIKELTGIRLSILEKGFSRQDDVSIAEIMSWARGRQTTRVEDRAYSLMGLFDVNMAMLYGEGEKAFKRLQEEIIKDSTDPSIFLWEGIEPGNTGLMARSPDNFPPTQSIWKLSCEGNYDPHTVTSEGISLTVDLVHWKPYRYLAILDVSAIKSSIRRSYGVFLIGTHRKGRYARVQCDGRDLWNEPSRTWSSWSTRRVSIIVVNRPRREDHYLMSLPHPPYILSIDLRIKEDYSCQITPYKAVAGRMAVWDNDEPRLRLHPASFGFAGAIEVVKSSSPTDTTLVLMFGFFDNFTPYCTLVTVKGSNYDFDALQPKHLDTEVQAVAMWTHKVDKSACKPDDRHLVEVQPNSGLIGSEHCRLRSGTLVLRPVGSSNHGRLNPSQHLMDVRVSFRQGTGMVDFYKIRLDTLSVLDARSASEGIKLFIECDPAAPYPVTDDSGTPYLDSRTKPRRFPIRLPSADE